MMLKKETVLTELKNVELLLEYEQYSDALFIVNKLLEKYPFFTKLLLLKGRLIQLLDEESELGELQDALDALQTAVELDKESIDALNELAMFYYAVEGNDDEAILLFEKSIAKCLEFSEEAYLGKAKSLFDKEQIFQSLNCLDEGLRLIPHSEKLKMEKEYILSTLSG